MITFVWKTAADAPVIYDVYIQAFLPHGRSNRAQLDSYFNDKIVPRLESGHQICLVMDEKSVVVGFALFEHWDERSYYLAEMALLPAYQGQGLGKKLVFSILEKDKDAKRILLMTEEGNKSAQQFYEKIGFKPSAFIHPDYPENFLSYEYSQNLKGHDANRISSL